MCCRSAASSFPIHFEFKALEIDAVLCTHKVLAIVLHNHAVPLSLAAKRLINRELKAAHVDECIEVTSTEGRWSGCAVFRFLICIDMLVKED